MKRTGGATFSALHRSAWALNTLVESAPLPGPFPDTFEEFALHPRDDVQTSYELAGSSGETLRRLTYFTPAIPAESTWLEVCSESGIVRFDRLEGRGGEPKA